jgi:hypothetical protein
MMNAVIDRALPLPGASSIISASQQNVALGEPTRAACLAYFLGTAPPPNFWLSLARSARSRFDDRGAREDIDVFARVILQRRNMRDKAELWPAFGDTNTHNFGRARKFVARPDWLEPL